jgi:chromosome segregation protein
MFLRALKLRGFKSFPDPVEIRLERGVAVVVGPNGSGKSNIGDAIVWAAGSQSPRDLRAEKPDDVLFAGAAGRRAADHCEVELLFDNTDGDGPLDYSELSIVRRLSRGGEGRYLVNRAAVRRLDVLELLSDLGLGGEMHSIISQGRVEQILASRPAERRALVEEAAGLGAFKRRRHRAELKLARVSVQVDRARDLEDEVRKRLRPLALQATAAARAEKLAEEIVTLRTRLDTGALADVEAALAAVAERRTAAERERRSADERLEGLLMERHRAEGDLEAAARRHEQATAALYRVRSAAERLELRLERAHESAAELTAEADRLRRLAEAPRDETPLAVLARAEEIAEETAGRAREAVEARERATSRARLARERLGALERGLAEREGLPPAARALADAGERLALAALDVDEGYDRAVGAALAWRASAVIAADTVAGVELLERARAEGLGTLTVLLDRPHPAAAGPPVAGAEPLGRFARMLPGGEAVARLLAEVWVVDLDDLRRARHGVVVTREGHGYAPERGELWFAGEAAESVLLALQGRRRSLAAEAEALAHAAEAAAASAAAAETADRTARDELALARTAVAAMPPFVDPRVADHLAELAAAADRLAVGLAAALAAVPRLETPLRARVDAGGTRTAELGGELRRLGADEVELRRTASAAAERLAAIGIEAARHEHERERLRGRLPEEAAAEELPDQERAELELRVERLERRREALGNVNPLAAEEHAQESERLAALVRQREDLERSLGELETLRNDLARTVETRFEETYAAVERHFAEVAGTLFPGGSGRLRRTDDEEDGAPGIEVELEPAGKRITRLSLLSGGEKALGAISFLFALFLAHPCPFYLLDEVEAALDDTNIGRFVELLRTFSDRAQFIVVTHQKRTMEAADILYGVTMASDGVSQVVSKRLAAASTPAAVA